MTADRNILLFAFALASCGGPPNRDDLEGTWTLVEDQGEYVDRGIVRVETRLDLNANGNAMLNTTALASDFYSTGGAFTSCRMVTLTSARWSVIARTEQAFLQLAQVQVTRVTSDCADPTQNATERTVEPDRELRVNLEGDALTVYGSDGRASVLTRANR